MGLNRTFFKLRGVVYHLWHKEADRSGLTQNDIILEQTIQTRSTRTANGADQYMDGKEERNSMSRAKDSDTRS
jgi:hypothetical protein